MYAILRTKRIKDSQKFSQMCQHNLRDKTEQEKNIDPSKSNLNEVLIDDFDLQSSKEFGGGYAKKLTTYYDDLGIKQRRDAVQAMEFVLTASPEFFEKNPGKEKEWVRHQIAFAKKEFGANLKLAVVHRDESNTHIHLAVSTEETKIQKFKNRYGVSEKKVTSLNAKRFNRSYLTDLHTRYAEHNKKFGLRRGVKNSEADHKDLKTHRNDVADAQASDYTKEVNKQIDKAFGGKNLLGLPNKFNADEIKKGLTPFLNTLIKKQKNLKTKASGTSKSVLKSVDELEQERLALETERKNLSELRTEYFDSVKSSREDKAKIEELQQELKQWKPEEKPEKPQFQAKNSLSVNSNLHNFKKPKI